MKHLGDITKINGAEIEAVDVITGGSPCQDLSIAGKRAGLAGARSGLFMEQIRIVKEIQRGYKDVYITCDSAEPKSVADYRAMGLPAKAAVKGPGSVDYGMKWLQRRKIVIDRKRTPNAYNEFVNYEYDRNKDGDIISGYPDENNHLIDATRYAVERISRRMGVIA